MEGGRVCASKPEMSGISASPTKGMENQRQWHGMLGCIPIPERSLSTKGRKGGRLPNEAHEGLVLALFFFEVLLAFMLRASTLLISTSGATRGDPFRSQQGLEGLLQVNILDPCFGFLPRQSSFCSERAVSLRALRAKGSNSPVPEVPRLKQWDAERVAT